MVSMPRSNGTVTPANESDVDASAVVSTTCSSSLPDGTNSSTGFWEVGAYRANVQRIRDGAEMLDELFKAVKERIEIEGKYGKALESWNKRWTAFAHRQMPEGCIKEALETTLLEGRELSRVHFAVRDRLTDEIIRTIELYKRENFHCSAIRGCREARETEDEFEKAQRQWRKLTERLEASKKHYHHCCRAERSAHIQFMNSHSDTSLSRDGADKTRDRHEKAVGEMKKAKVQYEQKLREVRHYNGVYQENMAFVFEKCQQMEMKRLKFMTEMISGMQKVLVDLLQTPKLLKIHGDLERELSSLNDGKLNEDLAKWSVLHGTEAPTRWPCFEEYAPEFRPITNNSSAKPTVSRRDSGGVVLTKRVVRSEDEQRPQIQKRRSSIHVDSDMCMRGNADVADNGCGVVQHSTLSTSSTDVYSISVCKLSPHAERKGRSRQGGKSRENGTTLVNRQHDVAPSSLPPAKGSDQSASLSSNTNTMTSADGNDAMPAQRNGRVGSQPPPYESLAHKTNSAEDGENGQAHGKIDNVRGDAVQQAELKSTSIEQLNDLPSPYVVQPNAIRGMARVLYDYAPQEGDEIALTKGEYLDVISGPDHLGWCFGRKPTGGKGEPLEGLFPAGYVEKI